MPSSLWNAGLSLLWYYNEVICRRNWSLFIQVFPNEYLLFICKDKYHYLAVAFNERLSAMHKALALEPTMSVGFTAVAELQSSLTFCNRRSSILCHSGLNFQKRGIELTYFKKYRYQFFNLKTFRAGYVSWICFQALDISIEQYAALCVKYRRHAHKGIPIIRFTFNEAVFNLSRHINYENPGWSTGDIPDDGE
jgi:hypothetical protein